MPARRRAAAAVLVVVAAAALSTATLGAIRWVTSHQPAASAARQGLGQQTGLGFFPMRRPAPAVRLPSLRGAGTISLAALAGKPIVLNFWSSSCAPCKKETPALASVARAMHGKVTFVGIDSADLRGAATAFIARYKVPYPVAFDGAAAATSAYGVPGLPVTFFLSPSGKTILGENIGALTPAKLRAILGKLYRVT
jgi:thiol-disulfide isomerase/thioredoxin